MIKKASVAHHHALYAAIFVCSLLHIPIGWLPLGRDQGVWTAIGFGFLEGKAFVADMLHFNLPGLGVSFAALLTLTDDPRLATAMLAGISCILILYFGYRLVESATDKTTAVIFCWLFTFIYPLSVGYYNIAQKDVLAMSFLLMGFSFLFNTDIRQSLWWVFLAGLTIAVATFYKPVFGASGILMALYEYLRFRRHQQFPLLMVRLSLLLSGFLSLVIIYFIYLYQNHALHDAYMALNFAKWYGSSSDITMGKLTAFLLALLSFPERTQIIASSIQAVFWLPILTAGVFFLVSRYKLWKTLPLWILATTTLFTYFIQAKGYPYQAVPAMITGIIFVAIGCKHLWENLRYPRLAKGFLLLALVILLCRNLLFSHYTTALLPHFFGQTDRVTYLERHFSPDDSPTPLVSERISQWIDSNVPPEKTIYVWGMENYLYSLSHRSFATRQHFHFFLYAPLPDHTALSQWQNNLRSEFIKDLEKTMPDVILVTHYNRKKEARYPTEQSMDKLPAFMDFIETHYRFMQPIDRLDVDVRNGADLPSLNLENISL